MRALVPRILKDEKIDVTSPDLYVRAFRKFGVDEAADIRSRVRTKPVAHARRIFVFFAPSLTIEAQNALLKTFEEPAADAVFFLVTPSPQTLLPTVRSRVQTFIVDRPASAGLVDAAAFLKATPATRLEMLKPLYEHDEDEGRDMGAVISFLQSCEHAFATAHSTPQRTEGLRALYRARAYAGDKGSLLKALLEQFALLTPKL